MTARKASGVILFALLFPLLFPVLGPAPASAQEAKVGISVTTGAFAYTAGENISLKVDLALTEDLLSQNLELRILIYSSALTRSYLASFREEGRRNPVISRTLGSFVATERTWQENFEMNPRQLGMVSGVYPFEVRLTHNGEALASDRSFLVIMNQDGGYPLNLSILWTLDFLPSLDAQGNVLDGALATACSPSPPETGYLYSLVQTLLAEPEARTSMAIPRFIYEELRDLAEKPAAEAGDTEKGASAVLEGLEKLASEGRLDIMATSYSFCDLDLLASQGWLSEADAQLRLGLEDAGRPSLSAKGYLSPSFYLGDELLERLVEADVDFTVVGEEVLRSSAAGQRLLRGTTISQPVNFINSNGHLLKGFVRDEYLYSLLERPPSTDSQHLVQNIIAELAVLQREKPFSVRSCVLAFPPSFIPDRQFLETFYRAVGDCPWLQTRLLGELSRDQFPLQDVALEVPSYPNPESSYATQLSSVRESAIALSNAILPQENPLRERLFRSLLIAMNHRFTEGIDISAARNYLNSLSALISGEISKLAIARKRSITLSGMSGTLNVDINSGLDYPVRATLSVENPSLSFPEGNVLEVQIEPRENRFAFPVNTHRKGSFRVEITLKMDGMVVDQTYITLNTSIINTLAVILLACLSGAALLAMGFRRLTRGRRGGKHSRGRNRR